jgi:small subunit ribosomal protein S4e
MVKLHLKRLASPKTWPIAKKALTFVARPFPGPHRIEHQVPVSILLRDMVGVVNTQKEVKFILHNKECLVDGNVCHDNKRPVGLFDVISLPKPKQFYRVLISKKNKLITIPINEKEASVKPSKIIAKTSIKKGKVQLNTSDGRSILVDDAKQYGIGDSLLLSLPDQKITEHLPLQANATIFLTGGSNVGVVGTVDTVDGNMITIKSGDSVFKTKKSYALVVGKDKPIIALE